MACRNLLHVNRILEFSLWLAEQGYSINLKSNNPYEVLRAKKDKDLVIIYCKQNANEHLSISDKDKRLVTRFIRETKLKK